MDPLTALRKVRVPLATLAWVHCTLAFMALFGEMGLFVAGLSLAAAQPLSAVLLGVMGWRLGASELHRFWAGWVIAGLAATYLLTGLGGFVFGDQAGEGLIWGFGVAAVGGPLVACGVFGLLAFTLAGSLDRHRWAPWVIGLAAPLAILVTAGVWSLTINAPGMSVGFWPWVVAPQVAVAVVAVVYRRITARPDLEKPLILAASRLRVPLVQDRIPVRVRYAVPSKPPVGLRVARDGDATPLGDPVLDAALPLRAGRPRQAGRALDGHQAQLLAVLHAWPSSWLDGDHVVWEASLAELEQRMARDKLPLDQVLTDGRDATLVLARVLTEAGAS
jgi:hypothetical protein